MRTIIDKKTRKIRHEIGGMIYENCPYCGASMFPCCCPVVLHMSTNPSEEIDAFIYRINKAGDLYDVINSLSREEKDSIIKS